MVALTRAAFIAALVAAMDSANSVREPAGPTADVNTPAPDAQNTRPVPGHLTRRRPDPPETARRTFPEIGA